MPSHEDVVARAGSDLPSISANFQPVFKSRPQTRDATFDINLHNKSVNDIKLDLSVLFEELNAIQQSSLNRILSADFFHSVHAHELSKLNKELDALLFSTAGAEDNFYAKFESFDDYTKTNQVVSTPGVIDLAEGSLSLPISLKGSYKIDTSHMASVIHSKSKLNKTEASIVNNISGTKFGNVFTDKVQSWAIECISDIDGPLELSFTFALKAEEFINRITVISHSVNKQTCKISTSVDNVNKKSLKDYASGILLDSQYNEASFDFEDRLVEFIHVTLIKDSPDNQIDGKYQYIFGLKNISIYSTGRSEQAYYESKAFDFSKDLTAIGKISLSATESIPENTTIDWSVGLIDSTNNLIGNMTPITPQNRPAASGPSKVVSLQDVTKKAIAFTSEPGTFSSVLNFQNINFYNIQTISDEPVYGTALLYRGNNCWFRDQSESVNPVLVKDNYTPFSKGDTQQLYQISQEVVNGSLSTTNTSVVVLNKAPLYDSNKGHSLIPPFGVNPEGNTDPTYAVYKATLSSQSTNITVSNKQFSLGSQVDLGLKNIIYSGPGDIVITDVSNGKVYQDGYDYIVDLDDDGNPTGVIIALQPSENDNGPAKDLGVDPYPTVSIQYTVDPDLTRFITKITGKQVFFNLNINNLPGSQIVVKYRHISSNIIKSSIKVKAFYGNQGNAKIYTQGYDYIYDSATSQIQRLTSGAIPPGTDVYVDYKYNDLSQELDQFFIWANVGANNKVTVSTEKTFSSVTSVSSTFNVQNKLKPDPDLEERLLAQIPGVGLVDLTSSVIWPEMSGWVQFVVKSIPPETLINKSKVPLIHQVIKMKDQDDNFLFLAGGKYFNELTAIREPLTQVSFNYLKANVLKGDDSKFSVKKLLLDTGNQYQVVVNFLPNPSDKLYQYGPIGEGSFQDSLDGIYPLYESWRMVWTSKKLNVDASTRLIVAATLSRTPESTGGNITPKVYDYIVKTGF